MGGASRPARPRVAYFPRQHIVIVIDLLGARPPNPKEALRPCKGIKISASDSGRFSDVAGSRHSRKQGTVYAGYRTGPGRRSGARL